MKGLRLQSAHLLFIGASPSILLQDAVALSIVAIVAMFVLVLVFLLVGVWLFLPRPSEPRREAPTTSLALLDAFPAPPTPALDRAPPPAQAERTIEGVEIDVPTPHVDAVLAALRHAGWTARETGSVIASDENEEAYTVLAVDVPVYNPKAPPAAAPVSVAIPGVSKASALHSNGDLVIPDGFRSSMDVNAAGNVIVGRKAELPGRVKAGGSIRLLEGAVVGTAVCAGELHLERGARILNAVEAGRGIRMER